MIDRKRCVLSDVNEWSLSWRPVTSYSRQTHQEKYGTHFYVYFIYVKRHLTWRIRRVVWADPREAATSDSCGRSGGWRQINQISDFRICKFVINSTRKQYYLIYFVIKKCMKSEMWWMNLCIKFRWAITQTFWKKMIKKAFISFRLLYYLHQLHACAQAFLFFWKLLMWWALHTYINACVHIQKGGV